MTDKVANLEEAARDLIAEAQSGNQDAFEEIYRAHLGRVYTICLRILGDRSWADDVAQQVFVRAWIKLRTFRRESSLSSWLYRIAINMIMSEFARKARAPFSEDDSIVFSPNVEFDRNLKIDLEKAISQLPNRARAVLVLHDLEGFKHEEIAEMMGLAVGTSRAQLARARGILKEGLGL